MVNIFTIQREIQFDEDDMNVDIKFDQWQSTQNKTIEWRDEFEGIIENEREINSKISYTN